MLITIRTLSGSTTISLEVESSYTVGRLRAKIQDEEGLPLDNHSLYFTGTQLQDSRTLADYNIQYNSTLHLMKKIFIQNSHSGKTITLEVESSDTIGNVKATIHEKEGFSVSHQNLFSAGMQLDDSHTLADYNIHTGTTLLLVLKMVQWMQIFINTNTENPVLK
ncbi:polyubiquitin 11-like protein [Tanacetum coccineum]